MTKVHVLLVLALVVLGCTGESEESAGATGTVAPGSRATGAVAEEGTAWVRFGPRYLQVSTVAGVPFGSAVPVYRAPDTSSGILMEVGYADRLSGTGRLWTVGPLVRFFEVEVPGLLGAETGYVFSGDAVVLALGDVETAPVAVVEAVAGIRSNDLEGLAEAVANARHATGGLEVEVVSVEADWEEAELVVDVLFDDGARGGERLFVFAEAGPDGWAVVALEFQDLCREAWAAAGHCA